MVAARAMNRNIHADMGICQGHFYALPPLAVILGHLERNPRVQLSVAANSAHRPAPKHYLFVFLGALCVIVLPFPRNFSPSRDITVSGGARHHSCKTHSQLSF